MEINEKADFSQRLNKALDDIGVPQKGQNRQEIVGKRFGVTQKGARKWLEAESIPNIDRCIHIAKDLGVSFEWLMTGRGSMKNDEAHSDNAQLLMVMFNQMTEDEQKLVMHYVGMLYQQREDLADVHVLPRKD